MLKGHPKGLAVAALTNMGERFGFYTMIAIFVLFLQAKYGMTASEAGNIYSNFLMFVYFLPLVGGLVADKLLGYSKTITIGVVIMFLGYLLLAFPSIGGEGSMFAVYAALGVISLGTGFFKGNLQALVGKLYDDPQYSSKRDSAFSIFYMCINIGAMFAPTAAEKVVNFILEKSNFIYDGRIPALAHKFIGGTLEKTDDYLKIAQAQDPNISLATLGDFSHKYIDALSQSYQYGFAVACISLIVSILIFIIFRKTYMHADTRSSKKAGNANQVELTPEQTKQRLIALGLVFIVVIFFWMSFHQNGVTMTFFARDYNVTKAGKIGNFLFDIVSLLCIAGVILSIYNIFKKGVASNKKAIWGAAAVAFVALFVYRIMGFSDSNIINPSKFQHFNPFFIVVLTPVAVGLFGYLNRIGKEPSAPRKIGYGMVIAAIGFIILVVASLGLSSPAELQGEGAPLDMRVSSNWLVSTYFVLTIAELFLSPMGISFVSKVSPPKYVGLMQGGWLAATAIGNKLLFVGSSLWDVVPLWALWSIFVVCCLLSAAFIFTIMKRLEAATK